MFSVLTIVMLFSVVVNSQDNSLTDSRDNKTYKTIKVGDKVWMAENLNYDTAGSVCYKEKAANCEEYGRLYGSSAAQKVCPTGWHLPTKQEVEDFMKASTGMDSFFTYSGLTSTPLYTFRNFSDLNFTYGGFSSMTGKFMNAGKEVFFWTSDQLGKYTYAQYSLDEEKFWLRTSELMSAYGCYVRCVKD